jgi:dolichyl-phosphate-mannose-protein mannosyltransferase
MDPQVSTVEQGTCWRDWLWLLVCGLLSSLWCLTAASQLSATFDEPTYIECGLQHWRSGSYYPLLRLGTMPLPVDVQTLPLYLWERWRGAPFDATADFGLLLPWARAMTLVFWWLLLFYAMRVGRDVAGSWGGRLAVALLAFEPSLIAHAALATTDIALAACVLAFVYHFRKGRKAASWQRLVIPAFWLALAILAKASGLVYGGLCMLAIEVDRLARQGVFSPPEPTIRSFLHQAWRQLLPFAKDAGWIVLGGLAGVMLYCGSDWQAQPSFVEWARTLPDGPFGSVMLWLAEHLRIFTNGAEGIIKQVRHNVRGHGTFILGHSYERAVWYYFPVLLTIKLTVPLLLAPLLLGMVRWRALLNWPLLTAGFLLLLTPTFRVQIGLRMILPLVVLAAIGLAAALATAWQEVEPGWRRRLLVGSGGAGVLWTAGSLFCVWPQALCYVNELYGGTANGYRLVSDANYDWGQGLLELAHWQETHGTKLDVWHYGTDPRLEQWSLRALPVLQMPIHEPADVPRLLDQRVLAVSTSLLNLNGPGGMCPVFQHTVRFLHSQQPVARTTTFLIYDFTKLHPVKHTDSD